MELIPIIESLRHKRSVFHSEADFQFALAWEIQQSNSDTEIRLEYPPKDEPNKYIDILVRHEEFVFPIELKYKTKNLSVLVDGEQFTLKNHGVQDLGAYDFVKDICSSESFATHLDGFKCGYVIWLTNDPYYWNAPKNPNAGYAEFSIHDGATKAGVMKWGSNLSLGTIKGREQELMLKSEYLISWNEYSDLGTKSGSFKYALIRTT